MLMMNVPAGKAVPNARAQSLATARRETAPNAPAEPTARYSQRTFMPIVSNPLTGRRLEGTTVFLASNPELTVTDMIRRIVRLPGWRGVVVFPAPACAPDGRDHQ